MDHFSSRNNKYKVFSDLYFYLLELEMQTDENQKCVINGSNSVQTQ